MKIDMETYKDTVQRIENDLIPRSQNDKELLTYLMKQDSLTLNQMKMCFTEPPSHSDILSKSYVQSLSSHYISFFSTHFNELIEMVLQMVLAWPALFGFLLYFRFQGKSKCLTVSDKNLKTPVSPE